MATDIIFDLRKQAAEAVEAAIGEANPALWEEAFHAAEEVNTTLADMRQARRLSLGLSKKERIPAESRADIPYVVDLRELTLGVAFQVEKYFKGKPASPDPRMIAYRAAFEQLRDKPAFVCDEIEGEENFYDYASFRALFAKARASDFLQRLRRF